VRTLLIGFLLAFGLGEEIRGSTLQLVVNLAGMAAAGWLTLTIQQVVWKGISEQRAKLVARRRNHLARPRATDVAWAASLAIPTPLVFR
jgi:hypothetical protein